MSNPRTDAENLLLRLFEDIRERDILDATWMNLTGRLLVLARRLSRASEQWAQLPPAEPGDAIHVVETAVLDALPDLVDDAFDWPRFISADVSRELADLIEGMLDVVRPGVGDLSSAVVAYGCARAIDQRFGALFLQHFRDLNEVVIRDEHPFPVRRHDPGPFLGAHSRNTRPDHLPTRSLDRTDHLGLGTPGHAYRVVLDFSLWGRLARLGIDDEDFVIATLQPSLTLAEYHVDHNPGPPPLFTNYGPADVAHQLFVIKDQLLKAAELGTKVVLAHEYSLPDGVREELERYVSTLDHPPELIVIAGVREAHESAPAVVNETWVLVPGPPGSGETRVLPPKLFPATFAGETENIIRGDEVRILVIQAWTIAVLTCRDAMDDTLIATLGELGVNLLLVPAMTSKTSSMTTIASGLRATSQAFTAIAVGPALWHDSDDAARGAYGHAEAVFSGPYEQHPDPVTAPLEGREPVYGGPPAADARGIWVYDFTRRELRWVTVPAD